MEKKYGDFELGVAWRIKESPYDNKKARMILPDGTYEKDAEGECGSADVKILRGELNRQVTLTLRVVVYECVI